MPALASEPVILEINAWVWLGELSARHRRPITLADVPDEEWKAVAELPVNALWLMGVWERSPAGVVIAREHQGLEAEYRRALPDFDPAVDVSGSPYCIHRYRVDRRLGGPEGLAEARRKLAALGVSLILDFVPNHVAPDHPWVFEHPEYFIQGSAADLRNHPGWFFEAGHGHVIACGRDPYFPAWIDTAQVHAFAPGLRQAAIATVRDIAAQCDGVRCDMAMLLLNSIFARTWGSHAGAAPPTEYWREVTAATRTVYPDFRFIAEAYWDLEWELQQHGFDFCYDKRLYDRMEHSGAASIRGHLCAPLDYQRKLLRFLENHDEPRAAATFHGAKQRAAAVAIMTLPGAKLLHEGQMEGARVKLPVQLTRRPDEPVDEPLRGFYRRLLAVTAAADLSKAAWSLCRQSGWPDNQTQQNLIAWCWQTPESFYLTAVNFSGQQSQMTVEIPWAPLPGRRWQVRDLLADAVYGTHPGDQLAATGLFVDLAPWQYHFLRLEPC